MGASVWTRGGLLLLLLGALFGLAVWHGSLEPAPALGAYPGAEQLGTDYDRFIGEQVSVGGWVVATDPVVIRVEYGVDRALRLRLEGLAPSVEVTEGDRLNAFGILRPEGRLAVLNAVRVQGGGLLYTYTVSFLAGLWVLGRIVRYWRVEPGHWILRRRLAPLPARGWLRERLQEVRRHA